VVVARQSTSARTTHDGQVPSQPPISVLESYEAPSQAQPAAPAFAEVFEAYAPYVLKLLRRMGVHERDLDDVGQEVFLTVHRKLPEFEGRSSLRTWVSGICLRKALDYRRNTARRQQRLGGELAAEPACPQDEVPDAEASCAQREQVVLLERALDQLSAEQRAVFVLYEIEELPMREVAETLGCPRFTAYTRLHAARRQVRAHFERARAQERGPCT